MNRSAIAALALLLFGGCAAPPKDPARIPVPATVLLPGGSFWYGSDVGDPEERPQQRRTVKPFAIGVTEVTVAEFAAFARAVSLRQDGGCRYYDGDQRLADPARAYDKPGFAQRDDMPVACVSWDEAVAYTQWLSRETGRNYRLPTEEEWEYAARAGERGETFWGSPSQACTAANVSDASRLAAVTAGSFGKATTAPPAFAAFPCDDGFVYAAPVKHFPPNGFGLYGVLGNVWEITQGCAELAKDEAGRETSECLRRPARGGSWLLGERYIRLANRGTLQEKLRNFTIGFRIAMDP